MGNYHQLSPVHLAPTAYIPVSEFHKVHGAVEFCLPSLGADLLLACVNLDKRTGTDQGKERVVFQADIAVDRFVQVEML